MLGNLVGGFIVILVGVSLMPTVGDQVFLSLNKVNTSGNHFISSNITGASATIMNLVPLFFALAIASAGIAIAAQGLRAAGVLG